nr:MAG TPA: hypothetical protein [Caudoviricetes sp.]
MVKMRSNSLKRIELAIEIVILIRVILQFLTGIYC